MRCHHITDPEVGKVLIPGCMAGAIYGPDRCTCKSHYHSDMTHLEFEKKAYNDTLKAKNEVIRDLEQSVKSLSRMLRRLVYSKGQYIWRGARKKRIYHVISRTVNGREYRYYHRKNRKYNGCLPIWTN